MYSIREISFKLSPHILQNFGLIDALRAYSDKIKEKSQINITIESQNIKRFDEKKETVIYRVLCECINNTLKHAHADNISISIKLIDNVMMVEYVDDGQGFDVDQLVSGRTGIGVLNMKSRVKSLNGQLTIQSELGKGAKTSIKIDFNNG